MKTSKEMRIKIYRLMADNLENNKFLLDDIQQQGQHNKWVDKETNMFSFETHEYRIKPETITLKNGVEIPKPLDHHTPIDFLATYYVPSCSRERCSCFQARGIVDCGFSIVYDNKEDAITASKALFGIE